MDFALRSLSMQVLLDFAVNASLFFIFLLDQNTVYEKPSFRPLGLKGVCTICWVVVTASLCAYDSWNLIVRELRNQWKKEIYWREVSSTSRQCTAACLKFDLVESHTHKCSIRRAENHCLSRKITEAIKDLKSLQRKETVSRTSDQRFINP